MNIYVWISQAAFHDIFDQRSTHPRSQGLFRGAGKGKGPGNEDAEYTLNQNLKLTLKKKKRTKGACFRGAPILSCLLPLALRLFVVQSLFTGERQFTELYYKDFPIHEIKYLFGSNGYM